MRKEERITTYVDAELYNAFKKHCDDSRTSMSSEIVRLITETLKKEGRI